MTREERLNNPFNLYKSEAKHIEHTMLRLKERHNLEITLDEYYELLKLVQKTGDPLYRLNSSNSVVRVWFKDQLIWLIYASGSDFKNTRIPARIKTILHKNFVGYPVPTRFGMEISGETLAEDVRKIIEEIKIFSHTIFPKITKKELYTLPEYDHLSKIFKTLSGKFHDGKLDENDLYRGAFKIIFEKYENRSIQRDNG
jgi:hypothetical protein